MPMDSKRIEELLSRYWDGETSVDEEAELREYFGRDHIAEHLKESALLFRYFGEQRRLAMHDNGFESGVLTRIIGHKGRVKRLVHNSMRIAAGIIVMIAAVWFVRTEIRKSTPQEVVDTYSDPELAFEETKKALLMISRSFGTAEQQAKKINLFNEAQEQIQGNEEVIQEQ